MVNTDLVCRNDAYLLTKEGIADAIDMLDGAVIFGAFIVKPQAEAIAILASLIQSDSDIVFEFHLYQTATAIHRAEQAAGVTFWDNDLFYFEVGIVEVAEVYKTYVGKQVGSTAGVLQFLAEILVGYLLLAVTILLVRESAIYGIAFLRQRLLHLCRVEAKGIYHIPEVTLLVAEATLRLQPTGVDAVVVG